MKFVVLIVLALTTALLAGCVNSGDYCRIASPIYASSNDILTERTKEQMTIRNEQYAALCGVK